MSAILKLIFEPSIPSFADVEAYAAGDNAMENRDRIEHQSMRTKNGVVPPLPLTYAKALNEAAAIYPTIGESNADQSC